MFVSLYDGLLVAKLEFVKPVDFTPDSQPVSCDRVTGRGSRGFPMGHLAASTQKPMMCLNWYVKPRPQLNRLNK